MTWQQTDRAVLALDAEALWAVLTDVTRWAEWCSGIFAAHLDGPLEVGQTGELALALPVVGAVHRRTAPPFRVVELIPGRSLVLEQPQPRGSLRIRWDLSPDDAGLTRFAQTLRIRGPLTAGFAPFVRRALAGEPALDAARLYGLGGGGVGPAAPKVVIAGGTGTLGRRLAADLLCRGVEVVLLTRSVQDGLPFRQVTWDGKTVGDWTEELSEPGRTSLVNLAGRLVDVRPTPANIASLRDSRVDSTHALVQASRDLPAPLRHWLQASTTAIYSDAGDEPCDESTSVPEDGLAQMTGVAAPWEAAFSGANTEHGVVLRTSLVLDRGAPVLDRLLGVTRVGLGGPIGDGQQWVSWIHVQDWLAIARAALGLAPSLTLPSGVVIAAAPVPLRNADMMAQLREHLGRPWAPPTPSPLLRIGSVALRTDPALATTGRHATSTVLAEAGYEFVHPTFGSALDDLVGPVRRR